jgi:hypothetical protein
MTVTRSSAARRYAADAQDGADDTREPAMRDTDFEKLASLLNAQSDDAAIFQMPSDLPLRCRTLSLVTHSDDCQIARRPMCVRPT